MKRFISILGAGAIMLTSSAILLNGCTVKNQDEQSSSQTQTPQEPSKEEQLQIEQNRLKELGGISETVKKELQQGEIQIAKLKEAVANAQRLKDPDLIRKATLELKEWEEIVAKAKRISYETDTEMGKAFSKIIKLIKEIKESKKDKT